MKFERKKKVDSKYKIFQLIMYYFQQFLYIE